MNRRIKFWMLVAIIILQIVLNRYVNILKINIDLLFLVIIYFSIRTDFLKAIVCANIIGLILDFFNGNVIGVFGFSRILAAFFLYEIYKFIDIRKKMFVFFLIFIPLFLSNLVANTFLLFISDFAFKMNIPLLFYQPFFTAMAGIILVMPVKIREILNVY